MTEADAGYCHGIDIGGTKMELVSFDARMNPLQRQRVATPRNDYAEFQQTLAALVKAADAALDRPAAAIGMTLPGIRERASGRQLSANIPALSGHCVADDLREILARPLYLGNDMQCFALSEAHGGAADGHASMVGIILGTGAGGGYCVGGRLIEGNNGLAGEWGHYCIPASTFAQYGLPLIDCGCGLTGCVDRYVSGSGVANIERHLGGSADDAGAVIALAQAGDARARQALEIHHALLGHVLAGLILTLDPHIIVLGGGLSQYGPLYQRLPAATARHLFNGVAPPPIVPPRFGAAGGARGAALRARQMYSSRQAEAGGRAQLIEINESFPD